MKFLLKIVFGMVLFSEVINAEVLADAPNLQVPTPNDNQGKIRYKGLRGKKYQKHIGPDGKVDP